MFLSVENKVQAETETTSICIEPSPVRGVGPVSRRWSAVAFTLSQGVVMQREFRKIGEDYRGQHRRFRLDRPLHGGGQPRSTGDRFGDDGVLQKVDWPSA